MKRAVIVLVIIGLLVAVGAGGWFGVASLNEEDSYSSSCLPCPTPPSIAASCDGELLCGLWKAGMLGQELRGSFAAMARACQMPTDPKWSGYMLICVAYPRLTSQPIDPPDHWGR